MDAAALKQRMMALFAEEAQERARALERGLLSLESAAAAEQRLELFRSLFRVAHSLKGAAGLLEIRSIESACHWMEEVFAAARDGRLDLDQPAVELLLAVTDAIAELGQRLRDRDPNPGRLAELVPQVASLLEARAPGTASPGERPLPPSSGGTEAGPIATDGIKPAEGHSRSGSLVRVPAERLDALLSHAEEILAARHRSKARADQISLLQALTRGRRAKSYGKLRGRRFEPAASALQTAESASHDDDVLLELEDGLRQLSTALSEDYRIIDKTISALDGHLRQVRMQPFSQPCEGLDRVIRDLSKSSGKAARLLLAGGNIELDRYINEELRDILRHLVRNAVDHGLEPIAVRQAAGKSETGQITISAALRGDHVQITVADDGRGLDVATIRAQALKQGIALDAGDEQEGVNLIFRPNFSTSNEVTRTSGRGVGLDIVKAAVEKMRGAIQVSHRPGDGTTFTLTLPLTLTTIRALLVNAGGQIFAIDTSSVDRLTRPSSDDIHIVDGQAVVPSGEGLLVLVDLADWLGLPTTLNRVSDRSYAVILRTSGQRIGVVVDSILDEQDLMVRSLGPRFAGLRQYSGGTVLADGRIALVLNAAALAQSAIEDRPKWKSAPPVGENLTAARKRVLVADDSITIRTFQKSILEAAGYDVIVASDGTEAWHLLQQQEPDIVVSDVEMPGMDGFTFTAAIRGSERFKAMPVVLLSAQETEQDRARGLQIGADAYLLKSTFDQRHLLETISQLV